MSRKTLIRSKVLPYHVTARTNNREHFHTTLAQTWEVLGQQCFEIGVLFAAKIHALVLMPNHFHLLISTPEEDLGLVMMHFMRSVTTTLNRKSGRTGRVFGGRYYWSLIDTPIYFGHALKYSYRNPVRAELCERVEDYEFSTLRGTIGLSPSLFPLHFPYGENEYRLIPKSEQDFSSWLNRKFKTEHENAIRAALKHPQFAPPRQGWKRSLEELRDQPL